MKNTANLLPFTLSQRLYKTLILLIAFSGIGTAFIQAKPHLEFDGTKYYRAWEGETEAASSVVEFLPKGQSLEHWNQMLSTRIFTHLKDPDSYLREMEVTIKKSNPAANASLYLDQHIIDFLVFSEDGRMAEFNIMKVHYIKGTGLYVQQFAKRYYNLQEKSLDDMKKLGGELNAMRQRLIPIFYQYQFEEIE